MKFACVGLRDFLYWLLVICRFSRSPDEYLAKASAIAEKAKIALSKLLGGMRMGSYLPLRNTRPKLRDMHGLYVVRINYNVAQIRK